MLIAGPIAGSSAKTGRIAPLGVWQKVQLRIDFPGTFCVKPHFTIQDFFSMGMPGKEGIRDERIGFMGSLVIDGALPGVKSRFVDGVAGAGPDAVSAEITGGLLQGLVGLQRSVGNQKAIADIRTVFGVQDLSAQSLRSDPTDLCRFSEIQNHVRSRLLRRGWNGVDQLVGVLYLGIRGVVSLDPKIGNRLLQTGVVSLVFDHSSDL